MENLNNIHIARGGGGGHGGGGGGGGGGGSFHSGSYRSGYSPNGTPIDPPPAWTFLVVPVVVIAGALTVSRLTEAYAAWKQKRVSNEIAKAKGLDPAHMVGYANRIFTKFQKDWSSFDFHSMNEYLTPNYMRYVKMQLSILQEGGRINIMTDIHIKRSGLVRSKYERGAMDKFSFMVKAKATDILEEKKMPSDSEDKTTEVLDVDASTFTEYWNFKKEGGVWKLDGISQDYNKFSKGQQIVNDFAMKNNLYYDKTFGLMTLPMVDKLFLKNEFGAGNMYDHVFGSVNDTLFEIYRYATKSRSNYLIARIYKKESELDLKKVELPPHVSGVVVGNSIVLYSKRSRSVPYETVLELVHKFSK